MTSPFAGNSARDQLTKGGARAVLNKGKTWLPAPVVLRPGLKQPARPDANALAVALGGAKVAAQLAMQRGLVNNGGVANPYGTGLNAYEPMTEVWTGAETQVPTYDAKFDQGGSTERMLEGYDTAYNKVQEQRAAESASTVNSFEGGGTATGMQMPAGSGAIGSVIAAAQQMLGKPYIWGGTTARGVDCSGLIYYAFNQAGIKMPRLRAIDYGKMGTQVAGQDARAGDLVFWDNPNTTTDHVGIYLGNGMVIQSPQSGDVTKISKVWGNPTYRRVFNDGAFGTQATPTGTTTSYNGKPAAQQFAPPASPWAPVTNTQVK